MKYKRVNANFRNVWNKSMTLSIDMCDENNGWTIEEWQQLLVQNIFPYVNDTADWYLSYFVAINLWMDDK